MIVLSRTTDQALLIGDQITVTIITIDGPRVELLISIHQDIAAIETTVNLQQGQQINLGNEVGVAILAVTEAKVQVGVIAPDGIIVQRKEQLKAAESQPIKPLFIAAAENQFIRIGEHLQIEITDIDTAGIRIIIKGELIGGPEDGKAINEAREIGVGSDLMIGTLVVINLMRVAGTLAHLSVIRPTHMKIEVA